MSEERRKMLKEMIEKSVNPVGWLGYHEGLLVSFLQTQEQVESFLKNTDTAGKVLLVYTHPVRELTDEEIEDIASQHLTAHAEFIGAGDCTIEGEIEFARAILRKASEK